MDTGSSLCARFERGGSAKVVRKIGRVRKTRGKGKGGKGKGGYARNHGGRTRTRLTVWYLWLSLSIPVSKTRPPGIPVLEFKNSPPAPCKNSRKFPL